MTVSANGPTMFSGHPQMLVMVAVLALKPCSELVAGP